MRERGGGNEGGRGLGHVSILGHFEHAENDSTIGFHRSYLYQLFNTIQIHYIIESKYTHISIYLQPRDIFIKPRCKQLVFSVLVTP